MVQSRGFVGRRGASKTALPPGQYLTEEFPVLSAGPTPHVPLETWEFTVDDGRNVLRRWSWRAFRELPAEPITADIHCVTRWSKVGTAWEGVSLDTLLNGVADDSSFALVRSYGGYNTNLPLEDLVDDDVVLALKHDGKDLESDHGGPLRLVVPKLYFWKSAKWIRGFEFLDVNPPGFWEVNGYHMHADPWKDERYSDQETRAMQQMRAEAARKLRGRASPP